MIIELLLFTCVIKWCSGIRLNPLENNDKLQDITNLYMAEWQWESWPIKQGLSEQEGRSPSQRKNVALWKDSSKSDWYLFGGQPVSGDSRKVYSDVWKFTGKTRAWKRFFPSQTEIKGAYINKTGGILPLQANLFEEGNAFNFEHAFQNIVLCGGLEKENKAKVKEQNTWVNFRKKIKEDEIEDKLASFAVYAPKTFKSNTVWQIDVKDKFWTAYVCCCDTVQKKKENGTLNLPKRLVNKNKISPSSETAESVFEKIEKNLTGAKNECSVLDSKIYRAEDEMDDEQQHFKINNLKNKKKKINQIKNSGDKLYFKKIKIEKRGNGKIKGKSSEIDSKANENKTAEKLKSSVDKIIKINEESLLKIKIINDNEEILKNKTEKFYKERESKTTSKYCPQFSENGISVTWCDGKNAALLTTDITSPQITLYVFNLSTSHWSQVKVNVSDGIQWPACSNMNSVRYAGNEEEVYIVCSRLTPLGSDTNKYSEDSTNPSKIPSKDDFNEKLVFRINYKDRLLHSLGSLRLNSYFNSPEGERIWQNDSLSILQVIGGSENETILVLAYLDMVDLWVLNRDREGIESFDLAEKIWRGSALKWFDKYNAALYSLQFVSEAGNSETILLPNPRSIGVSDYWPRERGRFIIRVFRNENLKNQSFENRTREQNLTYELLQSDYKPSLSGNQLNHVYSLKVLVFFGISLAMFTVFGIVLFLKRCVNCPPRIRVRTECHKSPLVIRYSVIPDDLLYPVA